MLSTAARKKSGMAKAFGSDSKRYNELYQQFCQKGYTKELCDEYAEAFINNEKKPSAADVIQVAAMYGELSDHKSADFYLELLSDRKLTGEVRYQYCIQRMRNFSLSGRARDAVHFRTANIDFIQNYMEKRGILNADLEMYIALALVDCVSEQYRYAFKTLNFGYKPTGRNDEKLLRLFITAVYIYSMCGDQEGFDQAIINATSCIKLFNSFSFSWSREHFINLLNNAANGAL